MEVERLAVKKSSFFGLINFFKKNKTSLNSEADFYITFWSKKEICLKILQKYKLVECSERALWDLF